MGFMPYYNGIEEIWQVSYTNFSVFVFKCKWIDKKTSVKFDESRMKLVDFQKVAYQDEPFLGILRFTSLLCR